MELESFSPQQALHQRRRLGIRLHLDGSIPDLAEKDIRLLLDLLAHHGVLCIVNQPPLTPRQLRDFAGRWGEVVELPPGLAFSNQEPGLPSITRVGNIRPDGSIIPGVRLAEYWHHDGNFWQPGKNFILNFLNAVHTPPTGGRTGFLDMRLAFDTLDDSRIAELAEASICVRASEIGDFKNASPDELPPDAKHPVCLAHPLTKQMALYLPNSSTGIQDKNGRFLTTAGSLIDSFEKTQGIYQHAWADGEMLIIDNLQVMHRSMGGYGDQPRLLHRCQARIS